MKKLIATLAVLAPSVAFAQRAVTDVNSLSQKLTGIGNTVIGILIAVAVIFLIVNVVLFIVNAGGDDRKKYQSAILWGIVGLFVILSIWGLVNILSNTFNTQNQAPIQDFPTNPYPVPVQ
ncbi:MAG: pilin [Candidatus Paceibacterota bacterium]